MLAIPLRTQEVGLIRAPSHMEDLQRSDAWTFMGNLGTANGTLTPELTTPSGFLSAMEFSPNGRYLATATEDLQVTIWAMDSRKVVRSYTAEAMATSLSWHPHKDVLAWTDMQGQLVRWESVIGSHLPNGFELVDLPLNTTKGQDASLESDLDDLFDDGLAADDDEDVDAPHHRRVRLSHSHPEQALSQPTFQPGSTPMISQRRYLCLSPLGTLTCIDQDTHQTVVFDSYDTSARRNFRFTDHYGYNLASMAPQGILFACPAESNSPSSVFYRPFDDVPGIQSEWTVNLPAGENAIAVALGGIPNVGSHADIFDGPQGVADESFTSYANAIVATTKGFLRFFGPSGMQRYVWALGASVVTLTAGAHGPHPLVQELELSMYKALLQLVQLACKADRYGRALDAARSLHSETTLEAALKIAHFFHLPSLADRMEQIRAPLAVRQQFAPELTERACGTDALLRNVARVRVPEAAQTVAPTEHRAAADELQKESFEPREKRSSRSSVLAQEGLAHLQAPDSEPSSSLAPGDWSLPPPSGTDTPSESGSSMPSAPTRSNPFARTQSIAKERHLQKSQSFFERVEAPKRKLDDESPDGPERRTASRQSTLASFAYKAPEQEDP
ncbi:DNA polymerase alpha accessory factor Mcl1 [Malassezia caprae]|uniref:DNA polymerase alpha accessory factor Mcl1 n=1 Tax=Malassezia caprae TaxID=1381934 RepID=A0AAF0E9P3_9BASI|nr:DNA polymerase alpha accessory factor Mcl1 [Malassezia caprae]